MPNALFYQINDDRSRDVDMIWELIVGTVLLTLLIVVVTPAMWSSRLSLRQKLGKDAKHSKPDA
ncbi:hypothetical protein BHS06_20080 [Myxococcus xanthus]|nr:hypothetical protein BHS06_20080 [Myxococcus xanthus]